MVSTVKIKYQIDYNGDSMIAQYSLKKSSNVRGNRWDSLLMESILLILTEQAPKNYRQLSLYTWGN